MLRILVRGGLATLWPWLILAISFGVNVAFYAAAGGDRPSPGKAAAFCRCS